MSEVVIELGADCPGSAVGAVAIRREPRPVKAACIGAGVLASLTIDETELTDRHLFTLQSDDVEQIRLASGSGPVELVRVGTGWHVRAPTETLVGNDVGQALATDLVSLVGDELVPAPGGGGVATDVSGHAELTPTQVGTYPRAPEALRGAHPRAMVCCAPPARRCVAAAVTRRARRARARRSRPALASRD